MSGSVIRSWQATMQNSDGEKWHDSSVTMGEAKTLLATIMGIPREQICNHAIIVSFHDDYGNHSAAIAHSLKTEADAARFFKAAASECKR